MRAFELIGDEKKLCRLNFAVDAKGLYTHPGVNPKPFGEPEGTPGKCLAVKWDIQGAFIHCYDLQTAQEYTRIARQMAIKRTRKVKVTNEETGETYFRDEPYRSLVEFNDLAPHSEIISFLKFIEV